MVMWRVQSRIKNDSHVYYFTTRVNIKSEVESVRDSVHIQNCFEPLVFEILRWLLDCREKNHPKYICFSHNEFLFLSVKIHNRYNIPFWHLVKISRRKLHIRIHWHKDYIYIRETEGDNWIGETRQRKKV